MALNDLIAQGAQFKTPESPLNMMAKMIEMRNLQQTGEMNQMKVTETRRSLADQEGLRNYLKESPDLTQQSEQMKMLSHGTPGREALTAFTKGRQEAATTAKAEQETRKLALDFADRAARDLVNNPSDANVIAFHQDAVKNKVMTLEQADQSLRIVLGLTPEQRIKRYEEAGATAGELITKKKPHPMERSDGQFKWIEDVNPYSITYGKPLGEKVKMTADPNAVLQAETTRSGQLSTAQTAADSLAAQTDPALQARIAGAKSTATEQAKDAVSNQAALPTAIAHVEKVNDIIKQMIGDANVDPKTNKVVVPKGGANPHKGFSVAVGASAQPGAQWIPGTDKANFYALHEQLTSDAFLAAYKDSLKGGGSITEIEGAKGTQALLRARTAQSEDEYIKAVREFQQSNSKITEILKQKAGAAVGKPAARSLSPQDREALDWATKNPNDPRAAVIKQLHGG